ncbi:low molecular weight phosphatase family protein [Streptomyces sp. GC420]|uniref:arsenate reductase/protein-tyrosine-phosphatase family protein n=1 Tax=Streptomyces sp. GC420 TaxID=2697568 RepID=UPI00141522A7|nr:low molecular weight phosphatase family protein [Streptomyces sp. GC420]NBM17517.1 low molecular weight phosphatase family protein [Streptomyces sp. GC420]
MADDAGREKALTVLFVCTGNMYRSPLAERLLAARLPDARVRSAGTLAQDGVGMDSATRSVLRGLGGSSRGFASRRLTAEMVAQSDLVLGMEREHRDTAVRLYPLGLRRSFTLKEFLRLAGQQTGDACSLAAPPVARAFAARGALPPVPRGADDIADPSGGSYDVLRACGEEIDAAVTALAGLLRQGGPADGRAGEPEARVDMPV